MWVYVVVAIILCQVIRRLLAVANRKVIGGQVVLITGGASGIGRKMALKFASMSCPVVIWDVNTKGLEAIASEIKKQGGKAYTYQVDVTDRQQVYKTADIVRQEVGKVDILINNAGIVSGKSILADDFDDKKAELTIAINTTSHIWTVRAFVKDMLAANKGHIVTIASVAGFAGVCGLADYCASKFGAVGFNDSLRREFQKLKKDGCHTTCICPYYINTGMFTGVQSDNPLLKMLDEDYVVTEIINAIRENREILVLPPVLHYSIFILNAIFPTSWNDKLAEVLGTSASMDTFVGRKKQ